MQCMLSMYSRTACLQCVDQLFVLRTYVNYVSSPTLQRSLEIYSLYPHILKDLTIFHGKCPVDRKIHKHDTQDTFAICDHLSLPALVSCCRYAQRFPRVKIKRYIINYNININDVRGQYPQVLFFLTM